jgi:hypothetical protein
VQRVTVFTEASYDIESVDDHLFASSVRVRYVRSLFLGSFVVPGTSVGIRDCRRFALPLATTVIRRRP